MEALIFSFKDLDTGEHHIIPVLLSHGATHGIGHAERVADEFYSRTQKVLGIDIKPFVDCVITDTCAAAAKTSAVVMQRASDGDDTDGDGELENFYTLSISSFAVLKLFSTYHDTEKTQAVALVKQETLIRDGVVVELAPTSSIPEDVVCAKAGDMCVGLVRGDALDVEKEVKEIKYGSNKFMSEKTVGLTAPATVITAEIKQHLGEFWVNGEMLKEACKEVLLVMKGTSTVYAGLDCFMHMLNLVIGYALGRLTSAYEKEENKGLMNPALMKAAREIAVCLVYGSRATRFREMQIVEKLPVLKMILWQDTRVMSEVKLLQRCLENRDAIHLFRLSNSKEDFEFDPSKCDEGAKGSKRNVGVALKAKTDPFFIKIQEVCGVVDLLERPILVSQAENRAVFAHVGILILIAFRALSLRTKPDSILHENTIQVYSFSERDASTSERTSSSIYDSAGSDGNRYSTNKNKALSYDELGEEAKECWRRMHVQLGRKFEITATADGNKIAGINTEMLIALILDPRSFHSLTLYLSNEEIQRGSNLVRSLFYEQVTYERLFNERSKQKTTTVRIVASPQVVPAAATDALPAFTDNYNTDSPLLATNVDIRDVGGDTATRGDDTAADVDDCDDDLARIRKARGLWNRNSRGATTSKRVLQEPFNMNDISKGDAAFDKYVIARDTFKDASVLEAYRSEKVDLKKWKEHNTNLVSTNLDADYTFENTVLEEFFFNFGKKRLDGGVKNEHFNPVAKIVCFKYLCRHSSNAISERVFSGTGALADKGRVNLSDANLETRSILKENLERVRQARNEMKERQKTRQAFTSHTHSFKKQKK